MRCRRCSGGIRATGKWGSAAREAFHPACGRGGGRFQCGLSRGVVELLMPPCVGATTCGDPAVPERLRPAPLPAPRRGFLAPSARASHALPGKSSRASFSLQKHLPNLHGSSTSRSTWSLLGCCVLRAADRSSLARFVGPCPAPMVTTPFLPGHTRRCGPPGEPPVSFSASLG